jgi:hypothetical protein
MEKHVSEYGWWPTRNVHPLGEMGQGEPLVHRADVSDAVTRVHHHTCQHNNSVYKQQINSTVVNKHIR